MSVTTDPPVGQTYAQAQQQAAPTPAATPREITPEEQARADEMYATLKPEASASYLNYYVAHTPPELHESMRVLVEADLGPAAPPVADPTVAPVANGAGVSVLSAAGTPVAGSPGIASVANSTLSDVKLSV